MRRKHCGQHWKNRYNPQTVELSKREIPMQTIINGQTIELVRGDITEQEVDAIVNAANSHLAGGGGVDGAIHRHGGRAIKIETDERYPDGCPTGSAVISGAGNLPAQFVIHAVGPIYREEKRDAQLLAGAYRRSLALAVENDCASVAFSAISCGVYGYPIPAAARIALQTTIDFLNQHARPALVRFVLFSDDTYEPFQDALTELDVE